MSDKKEAGVYLIEHEHGYIKIGRSENPKQRLASLRTATPYDLHILGFIKTDDPPKLEARLHEKYDTYQKSGEWVVHGGVVGTIVVTNHHHHGGGSVPLGDQSGHQLWGGLA